MKKNSPIEAGQTSKTSQEHTGNEALIDAINQSFALFKRNYHNQFFKAFAQEKDVVAVKRLWWDSLKCYSADTVMKAAHSIVKSSEFLPTLKTMIDHCERADNRALPNPRAAYAEACCAASPKQVQNWSHPAVYHAGRQVGWHYIQSNSENIAFPAYKEAYLALCQRVREGENLNMPEIEKIESQPSAPAHPETSKKYLDSLQSLFNEDAS